MCDPDAALAEAVSAPLAAARPGARARRRAVPERSAGRPAEGAGERRRPQPVDEGEFERLRAWRWERAEGKPAFTVAANAVLEEVLRARPRSLEELIEIRGIGPAFCEKHGESLLAALGELPAPA